MVKLIVSVVGLNQFTISFENYCIPCDYQSDCKYGKKGPFQIDIECKEFATAIENREDKAFRKAQKEAAPGESFEDILKKINITPATIFSEIWEEKIKALKDEITCLNSKKLDSMITSQQGSMWWADFREAMQEVYEQCQDAI